MKPKISVITVSLNAANTIERTIRSVLLQKYDNLEYIVIDGGSTDGTKEIIQKYSSDISYWRSEPDEGLYYAMNKGLEVATGDYVHFLNADDWYHGNALDTVAKFIETTNADVLYGDVCVFDNGHFYVMVPKTLESFKWGMAVCHPAVFVKRDNTLRYDTGYKIAADYKMMYDLYLEGKKFVYLPYALSFFSKGGLSSNILEANKETIEIAFDRLDSNDNVTRMILDERKRENQFWLELKNGENHSRILQYLKKCIPSEKQVVIWGTGELADKFSGLILKCSNRVKYFVNGKIKDKESFLGISVLPPSEIRDEDNIVVIVLNDRYREEIMAEIDRLNPTKEWQVFDYVSLFSEFMIDEAGN